jgi:hypothetical protein
MTVASCRERRVGLAFVKRAIVVERIMRTVREIIIEQAFL